MRVDVIRPGVGDMARSVPEPGTVKAFDYADLYAKVSGYLQEQNVDIGDSVKPDQLLAKISAPELVQAVDQARAQLDQAKSQVKLTEAGIDRAKADLEAAEANVGEKRADLKRETAYLAFRQIEYDRIRHLYDLRAIEEKLVDQNLKERDAAQAAENAAKAAIQTAIAEVAAKTAKIVEAQADLANAKAKVQVANAVLAKAKVFVDYLEIRAPKDYTGVITKRSFHVGDFIRAADQGGGTPLLVVARTDKMRVIMKMPETYVPYTDPGDPAVVELDALAGKEFHAKVVADWQFAGPHRPDHAGRGRLGKHVQRAARRHVRPRDDSIDPLHQGAERSVDLPGEQRRGNHDIGLCRAKRAGEAYSGQSRPRQRRPGRDPFGPPAA